jgi:protein phosphatase
VVFFGLLWYIQRLNGGKTSKRKIYRAGLDEDTIDPNVIDDLPEPRVTIQSAVVNDKGRIRGNNEDNFYLNGIYMHRTEMNEGIFQAANNEDSVQLYAVCDGMGGADCGEEASHRAVKELFVHRQEHAQLNDTKNLTMFLRKISDRINQEADQRGQKSGTTIAMMLFKAGEVLFANVGDSRIYRFRNQKLSQISLDHSKVQRMISMGVLTPEQAKKDPSRHVITQYLGMPSDVKVSPYIVSEKQIQDGDLYILCSDGLTDMVENEQIEALLKEKNKPQEAAPALVKMALNHGGRDNVTVMVLRVIKKAEAGQAGKGIPNLMKNIIHVMQALIGVCVLMGVFDLLYYMASIR